MLLGRNRSAVGRWPSTFLTHLRPSAPVAVESGEGWKSSCQRAFRLWRRQSCEEIMRGMPTEGRLRELLTRSWKTNLIPKKEYAA
jgi:hypothetical protein